MAIAGSTKPSFMASINEGKLHLRQQSLRLSVIDDPAEAVRRLLAGETIFLDAHHPVVAEVMQLIEGSKYD